MQKRTIAGGIACVALAIVAASAGAGPLPTGARGLGGEPGTPFGLAVVWRDAGRSTDRAARAADAFSPNGAFLGIRSEAGVSLFDSSDGELIRRWPADSAHDAAYSFAISVAGQIAIGRAGGLELRGADSSRARKRYRCRDACGPVQAIAFSPDGALLAYQGTRGARERRQGLGYVVVLDARTGELVARLEAIAARAFVAFTPDGRELVASNATLIDRAEVFGLRAWDTSDWTLTRNVLGAQRRWRAVGAAGDRRFVAAYEDRGNLEMRDLETDLPIWSVPLVGPSLDAGPAFDTSAYGAPPATRLELVELAPNGEFVLTYESPEASGATARVLGTIVVRRARDGAVEAMYDVAGVTDLAIAPDSRTFAYSTRFADVHTVLARLPY